jgi:hypothetical protein
LGIVANRPSDAGLQQEPRAGEDALTHLIHLVGPDLVACNQAIIDQMASKVVLIPQLGAHIVAAGGKRLRPLLTLAIPVIGSRLGIMAMGLVDTIIVGRHSATELGYQALGWAPTAVVLTTSIRNEYASLLRENTRFWNISGVRISGGLINLNVQAGAFESRGLGGVEFATPTGTAGGEAVKPGHTYDLYDSPKKEWLLWTPTASGSR